MKLPLGFQAAGVSAGIKPSGKLDLAALVSDYPLHWALQSTENMLKAPCVSRNRARHASGKPVMGIVVNSGNANCANGENGLWDNEDFAALAANALSLGAVQDVLTASTGVVGVRLPMNKLRLTMPSLSKKLKKDSGGFAEAIITTDKHLKQVALTLEGGARIVGVAKGSGMIHPNMATMLAFVTTDADISQKTLRKIWAEVVARSFNMVTVDGDTSPNDMALVFSSHQVKTNVQAFAEGLLDVCQQLAQKIARDGEGASKLLTVNVTGARSEEEARLAARAVARSPLVKAAAQGNDPNWGRILVAVGASGAVVNPDSAAIKLQTVTVYDGEPKAYDEVLISGSMAVNDIVIDADLAAGEAKATAWGCDLTDDYVYINADYTT